MRRAAHRGMDFVFIRPKVSQETHMEKFGLFMSVRCDLEKKTPASSMPAGLTSDYIRDQST